MKKRLGFVAAAALAVTAIAAPVSAAPSAEACHGQIIRTNVAFVNDVDYYENGAAGLAAALGISVKELQELVRTICG